VFFSLYFQASWPKWLNFFRSFQKRFGLWPNKTTSRLVALSVASNATASAKLEVGECRGRRPTASERPFSFPPRHWSSPFWPSGPTAQDIGRERRRPPRPGRARDGVDVESDRASRSAHRSFAERSAEKRFRSQSGSKRTVSAERVLSYVCWTDGTFRLVQLLHHKQDLTWQLALSMSYANRGVAASGFELQFYVCSAYMRTLLDRDKV